MKSSLGALGTSCVGTLALLGFALFAPRPASAQYLGVNGGVSPLDTEGRFALVVENDLFTFGAGEATDRLYTNGIYLSSEWSSPALDRLSQDWSLGPLEPAADRAYLGFGISHELHTPQTLNPCGTRSGDPLATAADPREVDPAVCRAAEREWRDDYGLGLAASLNWERILFVDPLGPYPSRQPISEVYHRYGRVALELGY